MNQARDNGLFDRLNIRRMSAVLATVATAVLLSVGPSAYGQWNPSGTPNGIYTGNIVGINTSLPNSAYAIDVNYSGGGRFYTSNALGFGGLTVQGDQTAYGNLLTLGSGRGDVYAGLAAANWSVFLTAGASSNGFIIETFTNRPLVFGTTNAERVRIDASGNVGIGTTTPGAKLDVNGSVNVSGNIAAKYQDVAEWVDSVHPLVPGTVVVLNPDHPNQVAQSWSAYDTKVAGVVSAQPGVILGEPGAAKSKIATSGRVKVRVDATRHPIHIGDLLVTSDEQGYAMYSEPVEVAGIHMHRPGTIIGKALEPLKEGRGEVLVLLSLQ